MHRFLLHNDSISDTRERNLTPGQTGLMNGWGVFSTLRVADGVLFAFERHWERMKRDAARMHVPFPAASEALKTPLLQLVEANKARNATLRVVVVRNRGGLFEGPGITRDFDLIAFTTDLNKWGETARLAVKPQARHAQCEFAGAKVLSWSQNLTWAEQAQQAGFDEVVLLNERGEVSECTSANIFAIRGAECATPPLTSGCLPGVTRELLLGEVHVLGINVVEKTLLPSDLEQADCVFITSTTRDLLPVSHIEGLRLRSDTKAVTRLSQGFKEYRDLYVQQHAVANLDKVSV